MTEEEKQQHFYKAWEWYDAPYSVRQESPWKVGNWIFRRDTETTDRVEFPFGNLTEEWEVAEKKIGDYWYAFEAPYNLISSWHRIT
jgi:hypothetical protein